MRCVEVEHGRVFLNHAPLYQRLVLDQGYWPETLLTPPSDDAVRADVEWAKAFGFNGARKHQKIEVPRYYYWADKLGLLVWGELPSVYAYTPRGVHALTDALQAFIARDFNHPCIIAWTPLNESWGVPCIYRNTAQQAFARALYHLCKALDGTRLVSGNDGWEQVETDIFALHDYAQDGGTLALHLANRTVIDEIGCIGRHAWAQGATPNPELPFLLTEYGGTAFTGAGEVEGAQVWGYGSKVEDEAAFLERYEGLQRAVHGAAYCQGTCYTQLTDVMQEVNGLLTPDRKPKIDPERFAALNGNPPHYA
jgi:beta-galactosidase/beta-glucuronidase